MSQIKKNEHNVNSYKMIAQSFGLIVCAFFVFYLIGEGIPDLFKQKDKEFMLFLPILLLPVAGYIITWVREILGAVIMIVGGLLLITYLAMLNSFTVAFLYGFPFIIAGGLFLLHISKRNKLKSKH